ncbi:Hpt domain-containing protein [Desulfovibrio oxyclinae]|jgi:two-component system chemotaxis sensor kinase CheA|uniref:Hpt domain-containing protein n=1 Tax=Desulfovibrio oxyclinae TaxID=63560 RepID=UPI000364E470|nr:Hpt domain-containing protein [Desulfovibrio oxyclinae]
MRDPVLEVFIEETEERLNSVESGLLNIEQGKLDDTVIHGIFRDAHSIKAGANLLKLQNIETLAHKLENILEMIRKKQGTPTDMTFTALLETVDKLRELVENVEKSNEISIRLQEAMLNMVADKMMETRQ